MRRTLMHSTATSLCTGLVPTLAVWVGLSLGGGLTARAGHAPRPRDPLPPAPARPAPPPATRGSAHEASEAPTGGEETPAGGRRRGGDRADAPPPPPPPTTNGTRRTHFTYPNKKT